MVRDCGDGVAGLHGLARQEALAMARPGSREGVRRQMLDFAYRRELGAVPNAFNRILGPTMQSLTGEANRPALNVNQPINRTHT